MIPLGGEAGNTQYDSVGRRIFVAVQTRQQLVAIDPAADRIAGRYPLPGADHPHGVLIDAPRQLAFIADDGNSKLLVVDRRTMRVTSRHEVGKEPDVSGVVTAVSEGDSGLVRLGAYRAPPGHAVAVDPGSHAVYLPLAAGNGASVLRILAPAD